MPITLTVYQGRAGDRNNLGAPGARLIAEAIAERWQLQLATIGTPQAALNQNWAVELQAAMPELGQLAQHLRATLAGGGFALLASNRCAASIATLPVLAEAHPDAVVIWFDAHADLNTPATSTSGFLGGMAVSGPTGLWQTGLGGSLGLGRVVLVGARDLDPAERQLVETGAVTLVRPDHPDLGAALRAAAQGRPVYAHLDCDVLEPGLVPTDFQVPGGLSFARLLEAFAALASMPVIGLEIAEFQARWSPEGKLASPAELLRAIAPLLDAAARQHMA